MNIKKHGAKRLPGVGPPSRAHCVLTIWRGVATGQTAYDIAANVVGKRIKAVSPHFAAARCAYATHLNPATLNPRRKSARCTDRMTVLKQNCDGLRSYSQCEPGSYKREVQWPQALPGRNG